MSARANAVVVVLIVVVGGCLVVPLVGRLRGEGQRTGCMNNLRQLGLTVHNYQDCEGRLPAGTLPHASLLPERRLSWLVALAPYLEQIQIVLDRGKAWDAEVNREPRCRFQDGYTDEMREEVLGDMRVFLCPGNSSRSPPGWPGVTHYVGLAGRGIDAPQLPPPDPDSISLATVLGPFGYDRRIKLEDIKDGAGQTLLAIETAVDNGPWTAGGPPTLRGLDIGRRPYLGRGAQFGGTHRGGATALVADGSARFLSESIDPDVFEALTTIAGGEGHGGGSID